MAYPCPRIALLQWESYLAWHMLISNDDLTYQPRCDDTCTGINIDQPWMVHVP